MKTKVLKQLALIFLLTGTIHFTVLSQGCLPEGITFTSQIEIDNFQANYPNCREILGTVVVFGESITNFNGLNVLTSINQNFELNNLHDLIELDSLTNLTAINGDFKLTYNTKLKHLDGLNNLTFIGGNLEISDNDSLQSLTGLNQLDSINGNFSIEHNYSLESISGFEELNFIGSNVRLKWCQFNDFNGLNNLKKIGGNLEIAFNDFLKNLTGLEKISSIGGELIISYNWNLNSIESLINLKSISGSLIIEGNKSLESLKGLDSISPTTINDLIVRNNDYLSICEVLSICNFMELPNAQLTIHDNSTGCDSDSEIQDACSTLNVEDQSTEFGIKIFPNPAKHKFYVSHSSHIELTNIYSNAGQKLITLSSIEKGIDISNLLPGIYIIEFLTEKTIIRKILVKI